jgi:hypothetical protein
MFILLLYFLDNGSRRRVGRRVNLTEVVRELFNGTAIDARLHTNRMCAFRCIYTSSNNGHVAGCLPSVAADALIITMTHPLAFKRRAARVQSPARNAVAESMQSHHRV